MSDLSTAEQSLRDGDPAAALRLLQEQVKVRAADPRLRVFLFQLLAVLGQWERALNQLNVAATLDPGALAMAQMYREAIRCEVLRARVFEGKTAPMVFGQPEQWLALLVEALLQEGRGNFAEGAALRARALDEAPTSPGSLDKQPFQWIADADSRLGPVIEGVINGRYYWIPVDCLARLHIEKPADLRDTVWMPAHFTFTNGGESVGLIPTRYPGSETSGDGHILLARRTEWSEPRPGLYHGLGQRLLTTDSGEGPIMDIREVLLGAAAEETVASSAHAAQAPEVGA
jgi:type VI secretion system protein ImpE